MDEIVRRAFMTNICGIPTEIVPRYGLLRGRLEKYLVTQSVTPEIIVDVDEERIGRMCAFHKNRISRDLGEYLLAGLDFYRALLRHEGCMLHASAVVLDGRAVLFSAQSGTGKSTHARLWLERFGTRAYILNDDKPALKMANGQLCAFGTPFSGKDNVNRNAFSPVQGICFLERAEQDWIHRVSNTQALGLLMSQTIRRLRLEDMERLVCLVDFIVGSVPIWQIGCTLRNEAVQAVHSVVFGEKKETIGKKLDFAGKSVDTIRHCGLETNEVAEVGQNES